MGYRMDSLYNEPTPAEEGRLYVVFFDCGHWSVMMVNGVHSHAERREGFKHKGRYTQVDMTVVKGWVPPDSSTGRRFKTLTMIPLDRFSQSDQHNFMDLPDAVR